VATKRTRPDEPERPGSLANQPAAADTTPAPGINLQLDDEARARDLDAALTDVQERYRRLARGRHVVDEFLADRRVEGLVSE
jgi:hypothetical protein